MSEEQPWYQEGLKFSCSQCGDCCTGAPGYVWVNKREIEQLSGHGRLRRRGAVSRAVRASDRHPLQPQ